MSLAFPVAPMKAGLSNVPAGDGWAFAAKWDGYRTLVFDDNGRPNLALVQRSDAGSDREAVLRIFDMLSINGTDMVEALLVCQLNEDGELVFAGRIATNFDLATLVFLRRQLDLLTVDGCRFSELPSAKHRRGARWVSPRLRATIEIAEFTNDGDIRHASFIRLAS
jgi:ATP-dependent DNA ligase